MEPNILLTMSVKSMKDTLGPEGLRHYALVFVYHPQILRASEPFDTRPDLFSLEKYPIHRISAKW